MKARPIEGLISWLIQLTLTLKMTTAKVFETSVAVNNSPIQDCTHPEDHIRRLTYDPLSVTRTSMQSACKNFVWFSVHNT